MLITVSSLHSPLIFVHTKTGADAVLNIRFSDVRVNGDKLPVHVGTAEWGIQTHLVCLI